MHIHKKQAQLHNAQAQLLAPLSAPLEKPSAANAHVARY